MHNQLHTLIRKATRDPKEGLNILCFPTHERYETGLAKTGHNFYAWRGKGIKDWNAGYAPLPHNYSLLNPQKGVQQIPQWLDIDLILSQNKFGQINIALEIAQQIKCPVVSLEHTLPVKGWTKSHLVPLKKLKGDFNVFISEYSRDQWGWKEHEAEVIHHGVDTDVFDCFDVEEQETPQVLSVVNDWINRDWCCGFNLWRETVGLGTQSQLPTKVLGDTPGLSKPASSVDELVYNYNAARVFLNTSLISPVPTVLLEAMACGCPIVSTSNCMIPEIIEHGVNGFLSNDPKQLRDYCQQLLNDKQLAVNMGKNARKTIETRFNMDNFVEKWNKLFERATNEN